MMKKLTEGAKEHLSIIHSMDVLKVHKQIKDVIEAASMCEDLQKLTSDEYSQLDSLLTKYYNMINNL